MPIRSTPIAAPNSRRAVLRSALGAGAAIGLIVTAMDGARAATAPAASPGSDAEPVDPIFAAIERHKAAWERAMRTYDHKDTDPQAYDRADDAWQAARSALIATAPITAAGVKASILYFVEWDRDVMPDDSGAFMATLALSPLFATQASV